MIVFISQSVLVCFYRLKWPTKTRPFSTKKNKLLFLHQSLTGKPYEFFFFLSLSRVLCYTWNFGMTKERRATHHVLQREEIIPQKLFKEWSIWVKRTIFLLLLYYYIHSKLVHTITEPSLIENFRQWRLNWTQVVNIHTKTSIFCIKFINTFFHILRQFQRIQMEYSNLKTHDLLYIMYLKWN